MDRKTFYHVPGSRSGFDSATPPDIDDIYASRNVQIVPSHGGTSPSPRRRTSRAVADRERDLSIRGVVVDQDSGTASGHTEAVGDALNSCSINNKPNAGAVTNTSTATNAKVQSSCEKQRRRRREQREREHRERERALRRERRETRQMGEQRQKNVLTKSEEDFRTFIRNKPKKPARPVVSGGLCAAEALEGVVDTGDIVWIPSFPTVVLADSTHKDESQSHKKRKGFIPRPASFDKEWTLRDRDVTAQELVYDFLTFSDESFLSIL